MPRLNATTAKKVAKQEVGEGGLAPLDPDIYDAHLTKVETLEGATSKQPYWKWTFELDDPIPGRFAKQYLNTSLTEQSLWKLKEVFTAFGVPENTDTDELLGEHVRLAVDITIIEKGKRAGQTSNEVTAVMPFDDEEAS